ncbi:MAG: hypothetical protein M3N32_06450 [Actinomycetota bacterium]|nr:hypothetical protein [Actinomycetota bacterium]
MEIADLGDALVIVPAEGGGLRALLLEAVEASGGYGALAANVATDDPDLA